MFNFPGSSEKERLRALVGLDKKSRMNSDFLLGTSASTASGELPESPELLSLLQKQDQIITELYGELESCKVRFFTYSGRDSFRLRILPFRMIFL